MFILKKKNKSGSTSVHILQKVKGKNRIIRTMGFSLAEDEIERMVQQARELLPRLFDQMTIFDEPSPLYGERKFQGKTGAEIIFGKIFDRLGFGEIPNQLFKDLAICGITHPGSKLNLSGYLLESNRPKIPAESIFHFLDKLQSQYKHELEEIRFQFYQKLIKGKTGHETYYLTPVHFENSPGHRNKRKRASKTKQEQHPKMYLGLLAGQNGFPIAYDFFGEDFSAVRTLLYTLGKYEKRFSLHKPILIAHSADVSKETFSTLKREQYPFLLSTSLTKESEKIRKKIGQLQLNDGQMIRFSKPDNSRLLLYYSLKDAKKDRATREKGLSRLEKELENGMISGSRINKRGFNKYLTTKADGTIGIDHEKLASESKWDGLSCFETNSHLPGNLFPEMYRELKAITHAFRIDKSDLKIKPVYHNETERIEAMNCISFVSYALYKELEYILHKRDPEIGMSKALKQIRGIREVHHPAKHGLSQSIRIKTNEIQRRILELVKY